jgi:hypothetical protein
LFFTAKGAKVAKEQRYYPGQAFLCCSTKRFGCRDLSLPSRFQKKLGSE